MTFLNFFFSFSFVCMCVCWCGEHVYGMLCVEVRGHPLVLVFAFFLVNTVSSLLFGIEPPVVCLSLPPSCSRIIDMATVHSTQLLHEFWVFEPRFSCVHSECFTHCAVFLLLKLLSTRFPPFSKHSLNSDYGNGNWGKEMLKQ